MISSEIILPSYETGFGATAQEEKPADRISPMHQPSLRASIESPLRADDSISIVAAWCVAMEAVEDHWPLG
jgi:hypothetical protein